MLEETVKDYAAYLNLDISSGFQTVQDAIDNMLTRLEELTSVLQMIKLKNTDCNLAVTEDINKHRSEITTLAKKINTVNEVVLKLQSNIDTLEKRVEKAEVDFGVNNDHKIKSFLMPFLTWNKSLDVQGVIVPPNNITFQSVLDSFEEA